MDNDYLRDRLFEKMQKYIPFLDSLIERLGTGRNSSIRYRLALISKIRAIRDLLLDEEKRVTVKYELLLKYEEALVSFLALEK